MVAVRNSEAPRRGAPGKVDEAVAAVCELSKAAGSTLLVLFVQLLGTGSTSPGSWCLLIRLLLRCICFLGI